MLSMKPISCWQVRAGALWSGVLLSVAVMGGEAKDQIQRKFTVSDGGRLVLRADRGAVDIATSAAGAVEIEVSREARGWRADDHLKKHTVTFTQDGNEVNVESHLPTGFFQGLGTGNLQVRYRISVPRKFSVDVQTVGGGIKVQDLDGDVQASTAGGGVNLAAITGHVHAEATGGGIQIASCGGKLEAESAGGGIKVGSCAGEAILKATGGGVEGGSMAGPVKASVAGGGVYLHSVRGFLTAETVGGGIKVEQASAGVQASAGGGGIHVGFAEAPSKSSMIEATGGGVTVALPATAPVQLDADTVAGGISCEFELSGEVVKKSTELKGKINGGGPTLRLSAIGGGIKVKKQR